jgi:O-succinylhomoserine sulfhydrylase
MSSDAPRKLKPATQLVHGGTTRSAFGEMSEALFLTQSFAYPTMEAAEARFKGDDPGFIYSRFSNPTVAMFEQRMILLEGAQAARATASGMAAVTASLLAQVKAGDHVVAARALFGSCLYVVEDLLPRLGVASTLVDGADIAQWKAAIRPETKLFFLESPTNPGLEVYDLKAIADLAHNAGARLVVDNVFATPLLQKPFEFGADVVVYSATKHIDGQGRCLGGIILASQALMRRRRRMRNQALRVAEIIGNLDHLQRIGQFEGFFLARQQEADQRAAPRHLPARQFGLRMIRIPPAAAAWH